MTISGSQLSNSGSGTGQSGNASASSPIRTAISIVSGALAGSRDGNTDAQKSNKDEVRNVGLGENNPDLLSSTNTSGKSRLTKEITKGVGLSTLPQGLFPSGKFNNSLAGLFPNAFGGLGGSSGGWGGLAEANYDGRRSGQLGVGAVWGKVDPLYKEGGAPANVTVLGASDSGKVAYGSTAGTILAVELYRGIVSHGQTLGSIVNGMNGRDIGGQTPHLTSTGSGLSSVSSNASSSNKVTGTGIILVGYDDGVIGTNEGANKMEAAMRAIGLNVVRVYNEDQYKQEVIAANDRAKASGGKDLLWVHAEAHGMSDDASGGHNPNALGLVAVGDGIREENLVGNAAFAHKTHKDVLITTGACHSGAIDAYQTFQILDQMFRRPVPEKDSSTNVDNEPTEPNQPQNSRTSSVEPQKNEPEKTTLFAGVDETPEEKRQGKFLSVEIA